MTKIFKRSPSHQSAIHPLLFVEIDRRYLSTMFRDVLKLKVIFSCINMVITDILLPKAGKLMTSKHVFLQGMINLCVSVRLFVCS